MPQLLAERAGRGDVFRELVLRILFNRGNAGAAGVLASAAVRRTGDAGAGVGFAGESAASVSSPDDYRHRPGRERGVS